MLIPQVIDENQSLFFDFNSIPPCLQQWLPIIAETSHSHVREWNLNNWRSGEKEIGSFRNVVLQKNDEYQNQISHVVLVH